MSVPPGRPLGSTYRLQLHGLGFTGAAALVGYLHDLGVETLYLSPVLTAVPGSTHGYDVVDPTRLDPALGTPDDFFALLEELGDHDMRVLLDAVPNHMAAHPANRWWWSVLAHGPRSAHRGVFDIDWEAGHGRVVVPALARPLGELIAAGSVRVDRRRGLVAVDGQRFPIDPATASGPARGAAEVLGRQHYRLAHWRLSAAEGNYRRFFDIDGLIGVRVEDPAVFSATHRHLLQLAADDRVAGLRVDHVDGLADPAGYLGRLRAELGGERTTPATVIVEKILGPGEQLAPEWPVEGTTGYEFADLSTRLFVDPEGAGTLEAMAARLTGEGQGFSELARAARRQVLDELFGGDLDRVVRLARAAIDARRPGSDLSLAGVRRATGELIAHLDVYRTYLGAGSARGEDRRRLVAAARSAAGGLRDEDRRALDALVAVLVGDHRDDARPSAASAARRATRAALTVRFQQLTGAVAAKGVEDTACYRVAGLVASAEVGGDPASPSLDPEALHAALAARRRATPGALNALSTHDTKRSADVRARLCALSEVAGEWEALVERWLARHGGAVEPRDALFFFQSLLGLWPSPARRPRDLEPRLQAATRKAVREAKTRTSWRDPDPAYERSLAALVDAVLDDRRIARDLDRLLRRIGPAALTNSLSMTVLAALAPGVPDVYQGTERLELSLMDPDNRRPVDFDGLARDLAALPQPEKAGRLLGHPEDGAAKLHVTASVLRLRRRHPALFARGAYVPLEVTGPHRGRVVALARRHRSEWAVAVVPRLTVPVCGPGRFALGPVWGSTRVRLPAGAPRQWADALTDGRQESRRGGLGVGQLLEILPVSVLVSTG